MVIRYPAPLRAGDRIGVTSPSAGVPEPLRPRLDFCVRHLTGRGYDVVLGECMDGSGVVSAPPAERGAELMAMLLDPAVRAVVPPWGGELGLEILPHLDFDAIGDAEPTWVVGYSDTTTVLLPLTTVLGVATVHGSNLMELPYRLPEEIRPWLEVVSCRAAVRQSAVPRHRGGSFDDWVADPSVHEYTLDTDGRWSLLSASSLDVRGRLIGGCLEILVALAGTRYGDLSAFAASHAAEGLIVYVEASEHGALDVARDLWALRLAGWFEHANAILVGRTHAPDAAGFTQRDAVRSALGDLGLPIVLDVDCGHVPPALTLINGASAHVVVDAGGGRIDQEMV